MVRLEEYKESLSGPSKKATLCFLVKENEILLARKKRGFGRWKWNGVGGKSKEREEIKRTFIREMKEEIRVTPLSYQEVAILNFFYPHKSNSNQEVHVFLVTKWKGEPTETEEVKPKWFEKDVHRIPFKSMWPDDRHWLPIVLMGQKIRGDFIFGKGNKLVESMIRPWLR